jgi:DNA-binding MarR family transcriptional regulator
MSSEREDLVRKLLEASRALSTETVMFHTAISEQRGLSTIEAKATDYLARFGPLTPKQLTQHSGLAPASVTALIDRLERKGVVKRTRHPQDRRKVLIELEQTYLKQAPPYWDYLISQARRLYERYSDEQLRLIVEYTTEAAQITHRATKRLTGD